MRWSQFYLHTSREVPKDAEVVSHQLMVRAGMIRRLASGIYSYLPLAWRTMQKLTSIVRREMNAAGAVELSMPAIQPAELWQESRRWQAYGKELLRIRDRHDREFCFGPTHEEVITDIVRRDVRSYRQLPLNLYQIQTKFRDEIRPRFGLMRGREFVMKDAYSFHADEQSLEATYQAMHDAYCAIFEACGLEYAVVDADSGTIGGSSSHEFMVLAGTGESAVVRCSSCDYGANVERAMAQALEAPERQEPDKLETVATPGVSTVEQVAKFLGVDTRRVVKTLLYDTENGPVAALVRGDREVNEVKLKNLLDVQHLSLAGEEKVRRWSGAGVGFAGPKGLDSEVRLIADQSVRDLTNVVCGANQDDAHLTGVNWERDVDLSEWHDVLLVKKGDACPRCGETLEGGRGIEVGHIFKLGCKYSEAMEASFTAEDGEAKPFAMGCYGLGIGRTMAAAIEQNHDEKGIIWPLPLAPFEVHIMSLNPEQTEVSNLAESLYQELVDRGVDVFYDDREERPGVKFKDADLIGVPVRLVAGARALAEGRVEISLRRDGVTEMVETSDAVGQVLSLLQRIASRE